MALKDIQELNKQLDRKSKVLVLAGLMEEGEALPAETIEARFADNVNPRLVDLRSGDFIETTEEELATFDQLKASKDPAQSETAEAGNRAGVARVPHHALLYLVGKGDDVDLMVIPIEGKGLWSTLYGFIALEKDGNNIAGITFYDHKETPGLGGEVDNPGWKAKWAGRKAYDTSQSPWEPKIGVIKGVAGSPAEDPYNVDGLSGATITGRGVDALLKFWLDDARFGKVVARLRSGGTP